MIFKCFAIEVQAAKLQGEGRGLVLSS